MTAQNRYLNCCHVLISLCRRRPAATSLWDFLRVKIPGGRDSARRGWKNVGFVEEQRVQPLFVDSNWQGAKL